MLVPSHCRQNVSGNKQKRKNSVVLMIYQKERLTEANHPCTSDTLTTITELVTSHILETLVDNVLKSINK